MNSFALCSNSIEPFLLCVEKRIMLNECVLLLTASAWSLQVRSYGNFSVLSIMFPISSSSKFQAKAHNTNGCITQTGIHYFEYTSRYRSVCHWNALSSVNSNESEHLQLSICCWDTWIALNSLQVNQLNANTHTRIIFRMFTGIEVLSWLWITCIT